MGRICFSFIISLALLAGPGPAYFSAKRKIDSIGNGRLPAGARVVLKADELNAYVQQEVTSVAPDGVRNPRLELGSGTASGTALVDFPKLRQSQGEPMNWLLARMLAGEREVRVDARIRSARGQATVDVDRVEVSGMSLSGPALDYLIQNYLHSYFPEAKVGQPFELAHGIDHLEIQPAQVQVVMKR